RHLRAHLLSRLEAQLPHRLGDLIDDLRRPTSWRREQLADLFQEVKDRRDELVEALTAIMARDRAVGLVKRYDREDATHLVDSFEQDLTEVLEHWWQRVEQLDREF